MDPLTLSIGVALFLIILSLIYKISKQRNNNDVQESLDNLNETNKELSKQEVRKLMPIQIYYGSQQGTAAKFSKILQEEGEKVGFITTVIDLMDAQNGQEMVAGNVGIFCVSTYGEGDPTDNAKPFVKWLLQQGGNESLQGFKFTVFGLGNTVYEHFNKTSKLVNKELAQQGAISVYKYGEGDDNLQLEEDFNEWKKNLWDELKITLAKDIEKYQQGGGLQQQQPQIKKSKYNYTLEETVEKPLDLSQGNFEESKEDYEFQTKQFLKAHECPVIKIEELRQNNQDGSTLFMAIDLENSGIKYKSAQNLGIYPENDEQLVQEVELSQKLINFQIAQFLNLDLETTFKCQMDDQSQSKRKIKLPFPSPITVRQILTHFCDVTGPVLKKTLKDLASLAINEDYSKELASLTLFSNSEIYKNEIELKKITIFDLLKKYQIKPSLIEFVELCPRISPRLFTIASSNLKYPNQVQIADSLLWDTLQDGSIRKGLCSFYLERLQKQLKYKQNVKVRIDFRESNFKLPEEINTPIVMIGPGTGIAPFISFLQEREITTYPGEHILYFGCRHQEGDYIYREQIYNYLQNGILNKLYLAFSRDQSSKIYVQDLLQQNESEVIELIQNRNATIYICGSTSMGKTVTHVLQEIIKKYRSLSDEDALQAIKQLEVNKKIIKELW